MKKTALAIILTALIFGSFFGPKKIEATGAPVVDAAHISIQSVNFFKEAGRWIADKAWPTLLAAAKKRVLDLVVDQTIAWIQGNGEPQFVTDHKAFIANTANIVIGDFVQEIGAGRICQPFKFPLQQITVLESRPFSARASCTLNQIVDNVEDFYNDFASGGWIAYNEALKPQNNIYGAFLLAEEEKGKRLAAELDAAANEVTAGGGFLSQKRCLFWSRLNTSGQLETQADNGRNQPPDNSLAPNNWKCTQAEIITPGKTVGDLASKAIGSSIDFIVGAEDISAYTAAIVDAAISRITRETYNGLLRARKPTINVGDVIITQDNTGCSGLTGRQRELCLAGDTERTNQERAEESNNRELMRQFELSFSEIQSGLNQVNSDVDTILDNIEILNEKFVDFDAAYQALQPDQSFPTLNNGERASVTRMKTEVDSMIENSERINGQRASDFRVRAISVSDHLDSVRRDRELLGREPEYLLTKMIDINTEYLALKNDVATDKGLIDGYIRTINDYIRQIDALPGGR